MIKESKRRLYSVIEYYLLIFREKLATPFDKKVKIKSRPKKKRGANP